ncbi:hypothetical protein FMUBM48_10090 [Nocardia cyriacigeorgica]|nr:hypothetical protein FMUBM48_10090 [Nocardia cyriacigeorgica]
MNAVQRRAQVPAAFAPRAIGPAVRGAFRPRVVFWFEPRAGRQMTVSRFELDNLRTMAVVR